MQLSLQVPCSRVGNLSMAKHLLYAGRMEKRQVLAQSRPSMQLLLILTIRPLMTMLLMMPMTPMMHRHVVRAVMTLKVCNHQCRRWTASTCQSRSCWLPSSAAQLAAVMNAFAICQGAQTSAHSHIQQYKLSANLPPLSPCFPRPTRMPDILNKCEEAASSNRSC